MTRQPLAFEKLLKKKTWTAQEICRIIIADHSSRITSGHELINLLSVKSQVEKLSPEDKMKVGFFLRLTNTLTDLMNHASMMNLSADDHFNLYLAEQRKYRQANSLYLDRAENPLILSNAEYQALVKKVLDKKLSHRFSFAEAVKRILRKTLDAFEEKKLDNAPTEIVKAVDDILAKQPNSASRYFNDLAWSRGFVGYKVKGGQRSDSMTSDEWLKIQPQPDQYDLKSALSHFRYLLFIGIDEMRRTHQGIKDLLDRYSDDELLARVETEAEIAEDDVIDLTLRDRILCADYPELYGEWHKYDRPTIPEASVLDFNRLLLGQYAGDSKDDDASAVRALKSDFPDLFAVIRDQLGAHLPDALGVEDERYSEPIWTIETLDKAGLFPFKGEASAALTTRELRSGLDQTDAPLPLFLRQRSAFGIAVMQDDQEIDQRFPEMPSDLYTDAALKVATTRRNFFKRSLCFLIALDAVLRSMAEVYRCPEMIQLMTFKDGRFSYIQHITRYESLKRFTLLSLCGIDGTDQQMKERRRFFGKAFAFIDTKALMPTDKELELAKQHIKAIDMKTPDRTLTTTLVKMVNDLAQVLSER